MAVTQLDPAVLGRWLDASDAPGDGEQPVLEQLSGGSQNTLLCRLTAEATGLPVVAGPVEATAIGNVLVQARAHGLVSGDLEALRALVARSFPVTRYRP